MEKDYLKVSEIFRSIQGEGRYQGIPATFIRLSGCTRKCSFCDSKYHTKGKQMFFKAFNSEMLKEASPTFIFTGGEPLAQWGALKKFLNDYYPFANGSRFHLETNGDLIKDVPFLVELLKYFNYIAVSPKDLKTAKRVNKIITDYRNNYCCAGGGFIDIKIVTDLDKVGTSMLKYATVLMPLTTYKVKLDKLTRQKVWGYCIEKRIFYSDRLHISLWGKQRKI